MRSHFVKLKRDEKRPRRAQLAIALVMQLVMPALAALIAAGGPAAAAGPRSARLVESIESRDPGEPILAIVSLHSQRVTVYDTQGWILRAPVSSGQKGRETPAGIFSVIQKEADHYSNIYDDAYMPNMQRITWSGIALHGGVLPGYPASHGCIRMPYEFAERLFDVTRLGLRVIVAPSDVTPVEIAHPLLSLFLPKPGADALAAARTAEADEAARKADSARLAAGTAFREAAQARVPVRSAENLMVRAEAQLVAAETALGSANSAEAKEQAERVKIQAAAKVFELQAQLAAAKADLQPKLDNLASTRDAATAADAARAAAAEAARQVARKLEPVSVLISRKTQKLYVRQAFEPILESPVTIQDPDRPIGTHVFTAIARTNGDSDMRWSVVSLDDGRPHATVVEPQSRARASHARDVEPMPTDPDNAKSALDRITIPQDVWDHIAGTAPRSSLIVTDEALSTETGKGTDFVVVLSGEPQGGLKMRRRAPSNEFSFGRSGDRPFFWRSPFSFSTW
jgi:L,D-transpeptidase catalytic domain